MKISLGHEGPTDCCLILHKGNKTKEYLIETLSWRLLDIYWDISNQTGEIPKKLGNAIWECGNKDANPFYKSKFL